jgi:hypothetical protein
MSIAEYFPEQISLLPTYEGRFDPYKLNAESCDVPFGIYPGSTVIEPHSAEGDAVPAEFRGGLRAP